MDRRRFLEGSLALILGLEGLPAFSQDRGGFYDYFSTNKPPTLQELKPDEIPARAPLLPCRQRERLDCADIQIARYLEEHCQDKKERIVIFDCCNCRLEDITTCSYVSGACFDQEKLDNALNSGRHIIFAHPHIINIQEFYTGSRGQVMAVDDTSLNIQRRRVMYEIPSPPQAGQVFNLDSDGDILTMLNLMTDHYPENPRLFLDSRLVVLEPGLPPRVIRYNASNDVACKMKRANKGNPKDMKSLEDMGESITNGYNAMFLGYLVDKYRVFDELRDGIEEPSFPEFAEKVNERGELMIRDRGYLPEKK